MPPTNHMPLLFLVTAHMPRMPREPSEGDHVFTLRLNNLFETRRDPEGKPYSVRQVAAQVGMSASHLSNLRRGRTTRPGADKIEALARFFGVEMAYFMGSERVTLPDETTAHDEVLRKALENPLVREVAVTTGQFNQEQWKHMLAILEHQVEIQRIAEERVREEYERKAAVERPPRDISTSRHRRKDDTSPRRDEDAGDGERG